MAIERRSYGPLTIFPLAFGAGHIGDPEQDDQAIGQLLNQAVDLGINLFDTALSYGLSEDRIRRHLGPRRHEVLLSTKVGYGVPGHEDWTPGCIAAGIDQALRNMGTDHIDIVHLHSCPRQMLESGSVIEPLLAAVDAGKIRMAAYSGDNDALAWAVDSGRFHGVQASFSVVDRANQETLRRAIESKKGVLVKRPLLNAVWRYTDRPEAPDHQTYWDRWQALALPDFDLPPAEVALRFANDRTHGILLVGTTKVTNLQKSIDALARGPLDDSILKVLDERWQAAGGWPAMI